MKLLCAALVLLAGFPATATAAWTGPMRVPGSAGAMLSAAAVNGRGDVAVAWIEEGRSGGRATLRVRAAVRRASAARYSVRTLVARRGFAARGTAVALDAHGELTVAWIEQASDNGRLHGSKTVRAAFRRSGGRWSRVQAVGRSTVFNNAMPRLLTRPDRSVVLTYNASGVAAAWRSPGRPFGTVRRVPVSGSMIDPTLAVDPAGRVFLTGTRGCNGSGAAVRVATAPPGRRRFTTATTVARAPGKLVRMAVMGRGAVALAWLDGRCSRSEATGGTPYAATVVGGAASTPVALGTTGAAALVASPAPGGADVSFSSPPSTQLLVARVNRAGVGAPAVAPDGWIALAGDAAGDQLAGHPDLAGAVTTPLAARSATGSALAPAPFAATGYRWTAGTFAARDGRALAALSFRPLSSMTPSIVLAVWRP